MYIQPFIASRSSSVTMLDEVFMSKSNQVISLLRVVIFGVIHIFESLYTYNVTYNDNDMKTISSRENDM